MIACVLHDSEDLSITESTSNSSTTTTQQKVSEENPQKLEGQLAWIDTDWDQSPASHRVSEEWTANAVL